jgi:hypothetical protein
MSSSTSNPQLDARPPAAARFRKLFAREPSPRDLARHAAAHHALALGVPARSRRAAARLIVRL